uniref:Cadherin 26 n=1 Tax=Microcebus murinus TaxID=30608 RepID=A0A8C5Y7S0_MICMU
MQRLLWTQSDVRGQMRAPPTHTAVAGARLSAKVYPGGAVPGRRLAPVGGRIAEMLRQKLRGVDAREDDADCQPRAYLEEGRSAGAPSLSSLAVSEQGLPPDLLDGLGWKAAALADTYAERGVSSS